MGDVIDLPDSAVIASAAGGADPTAGEITIDSKVLVIPQQLDPGQRAGWLRWPGKDRRRQHPVPGGDFEALLARGDISATGGDPTRAGTIAVNAPEVHLSGGLVVVKALFSMRPSCASASLRDATWMPAASSVWAAAACSQVPMDRSPARR